MEENSEVELIPPAPDQKPKVKLSKQQKKAKAIIGEEKLEEYKELFTKFDKDGGGTIDRAELQ